MALQHVEDVKRYSCLVVERVVFLLMSLLNMVAHINNILLLGIKVSPLYLTGASVAVSSCPIAGGRGIAKEACIATIFKPCPLCYCLG